MNGLFGKNYIEALKKRGEKKRPPPTERHMLAGEIWEYFGKKKGKEELNFMRVLGMIDRFGKAWVRECFSGAKDARCKDMAKLFVWKVYQVKVSFREMPPVDNSAKA